jgi:hypothetical protein
LRRIQTLEFLFRNDKFLFSDFFPFSCQGRVHFVVKDVDAFTSQILPKYYRTHKMTSFMRQLNNYGFSKVKPTDLNDKTCEFEHEHNLLQPNRPDLLFKIARRRTARRGAADSKKTRPSAHQLFRSSAAVPVPKRQTSTSAMQSPPPPTSSSSAAASTNSAAATVVDQQSLAQTVAALQAHLAAQAALLAQGGVAVSAEVAAALQKTAMLLSTQTPLVQQQQEQQQQQQQQQQRQEKQEQTSPSSSRPRRNASVAARDAIRAAVQEGGEDVTDDVDVVSRDLHSLASASYAVSAAGRHQSASGGTGNAADESSEFDSHGDGSHASISEMAQTERSQAQIHRLRMHEDKLSLTSNGGAKPFAFAVPQVPSGTKQSSSQSQPQPQASASTSASQAAQPQVVVQTRVGLTKSGEVWKSMIQAAVVEPSPVVNTAALTLMTNMDMPRSNSVSDFFGAKREAAENALDTTEFRDVLLDDTRGFLKSSHGIKM